MAQIDWLKLETGMRVRALENKLSTDPSREMHKGDVLTIRYIEWNFSVPGDSLLTFEEKDPAWSVFARRFEMVTEAEAAEISNPNPGPRKRIPQLPPEVWIDKSKFADVDYMAAVRQCCKAGGGTQS